MNAKEIRVSATAIQWRPEHADEIIARLASLGIPEDAREINGDTIVFVDGQTAWPGQWILLTCGHIFVVEDEPQ